ncbi:MAG: GNAT family N-acetyltransferase [Culicoidibacterales bacterium]
MDYTIRLELPADFHTVESVTRDAFWNLYIPGCNEHLIIHHMRNSKAFIPNLAFVIEINNKIIGNIMFTHSQIVNADNHVFKTITIGPVSIAPQFMNKGYGTKLINFALQQAKKLNYQAVLLYGYPSFYTKLGFKLAADFNISRSDGLFAQALLALELHPNALARVSGCFQESDLYHHDNQEMLDKFDERFPPKIKSTLPSQAQFALMVDAIIK